MAQGTSEAFFGIELSAKTKEFEWNGPEETEDDVETKLQILQACLGAGAKEGERNIVDVTTSNVDGDDVTHTILSMRLGQTEMARMDLGFVDKATFKLVKGSGPVHLCGLLLQAYSPISDDEEEESDDEDAPELVEASEKKDVDEEKPKLTEAKNKGKGEPAKKTEGDDMGLLDDEASEDDEDEEMSDEGDELDSDEDDDDDDDLTDEEEEEDEEELEPPKSKKAKVVANGIKEEKGKSPGKKQEAKKAETPKKQPEKKDDAAAEQKTPKSEKKGGKEAKTPKSAPSIDEVKKKLLKSPNLPKTAEKFKNFMKSAHRITNESDVQGIWDWLQKNKK